MDVLLSDSDLESFSESGCSEEQEEVELLYGGQAQSLLSSLEESIGKIDDFLSFERGFMHGDIVCSVTEPSGQMGRVININMFVDLENVYGKIIKDVNSKKLLKIRTISVGDYVVHGTWLGRVDKVVDSVSVLFDDGSECEFIAMDREKLLPVPPNLLEDSQYPYYPGQRVQVRLPNVSKSTGWLCGAWRNNQNEGTVCAVEAGLVYVDWLSSVLMGCDLHLPAPARLQDAKNLTLLSCFSHANWQLGDWCILPIADCKGIMEQDSLNASAHGFIKDQKMLEGRFMRRNLSSSLEDIFVIAKTKTKVDVAWQDGSCSLGLDSQTLLPIGVVNAHEFWPDQFVLEKGICDDPHVTKSQRWGVVLGVDAKERTVKVQWKSMAVKEATDFDGEKMEETVSAYELVEHPDYSYCCSDVVFRLVRNQSGDQADKDQLSTEIGMDKEASLENKNIGQDQNVDPDANCLSFIGIVTGLKDGSVEVQWTTGFTTKVAPYEIYQVDKNEGSATSPVHYEENVEDLNQEMIEHDKQLSSQRGKDLLNFDGAGESCKKYSWESNSFFLPRAAIGFFSSIAASLFGSFGSTSLSGPESSGQISEDENESESEILLEREVSETCDLCCELYPSKTKLKQEVKENQENETFTFSIAGENPDQFRQFDMVNDCSDHHFLDANKGSALSQVKKGWLKKVQQEWSILEKNLPESIYVRIYEERMDLIRAAIVGAPGTPYHDGIFFFDIFLPPEYPYEPPSVHYNSGGLRVNPNLYESGKVCLSLLNTWTGTGTEVWNPGSSTILQVLLSLQALVLNDKPYFNEAGYDKQMGRAEGEKNSISYNENAFLVTCKSMLYLLRKPPQPFEAFVEEHFSRRSKCILLACKAYMEGAPVGFAFGGEETERENANGNSRGFKIMLAKLFPKLVEAFSDKGIDCSQFIQPKK